REERPVDEHRDRLPVAVVRPGEVTEVPGLAGNEVVPVVELEPFTPSGPEEERDQQREERAVRDDDPGDPPSANRRFGGVRALGCLVHDSNANSCQASGTPLSACPPRSTNTSPDPPTRSRTVRDAS